MDKRRKNEIRDEDEGKRRNALGEKIEVKKYENARANEYIKMGNSLNFL